MPPILIDSGYRTSATYRLADPIENMQLEVTLRKRGTRGERRVRDPASEKPKGPRKPDRGSIAFGRASRPDPEPEEQEDPDAEKETAGAPGAAGAAGAEVEEEDMVVASTVFHWQEKIFSPSEVSEVRTDVRRASRGEGGGGLLARFFSRQRDDFVRVRRRELPNPNPKPGPGPALTLTLTRTLSCNPTLRCNPSPSLCCDPVLRPTLPRRELLGQLDAEAERVGGAGTYSGHALHSRVDWEGEGDSGESSARFTTSGHEVLTPLARSHLTGALAEQHRDALGEVRSGGGRVVSE
jgi:hypothetical protein